MLLFVRFLRTRHGVSRTHQARGRRTPEFGTGAQCAMLHRRPRARRFAAGSQLVCRVDFVLPRRRLTHLCRKRRVPRWRLHRCVQRSAPGQNSSSSRSVRPNWLLNSPSLTVDGSARFVHTVTNQTGYRIRQPSSTSQTRQSRHLPFVRGVQSPSWPMTTPPANGVRHGSQRSLPRGCRRRDNELE